MIFNLKKLINNRNNINTINIIALPLILNSLTGLLIGILDQAMVGRISIFAYGAVGVIATTLYSVSGIIGMIAVSFNILGSQSMGLNDNEDLYNKFRITLILSLLIGLLFYTLILIFKIPMLKIVFGLEGEILDEAVRYLNIFGLSVGLNLIIFVFSSLFKILKMTKWIFYGSLIANISNLVIDYILIFGKFGINKMGVTGAAIGSVVALFINIVIYILAIKNRNILKIEVKDCKSYIKQLVKKTIPLMGQEFLEGTLFSISIIAIISRIGVLEVASYTLLFNIINILLMPMYAYSSASLNLVSECSVSKSKNEMKKIPKLCFMMSVLFYIISSLIIILFKRTLLGFMTNDISVINFSSNYLILAISIQAFNLAHSIYKYSLQGINDEKWVFIVSLVINLVSMAGIVLLVFIFKMNFSGVYVGIGINYLLLSLLFYYKYSKSIDRRFILETIKN
jgi:putative MATE family efflux protein